MADALGEPVRIDRRRTDRDDGGRHAVEHVGERFLARIRPSFRPRTARHRRRTGERQRQRPRQAAVAPPAARPCRDSSSSSRSSSARTSLALREEATPVRSMVAPLSMAAPLLVPSAASCYAGLRWRMRRPSAGRGEERMDRPIVHIVVAESVVLGRPGLAEGGHVPARMPDLTQLLDHWGYVALFVVVVLGNVGVPLPEETVLALAGYLVWRGDMRLPVVLVVGVVSAVAGDNLGYWVGRRFGRSALPRYARWVLGHPERLATMADFIERRGPFAVFVARFIPGIRFMAGPLAGGLGMHFTRFFAANVLGRIGLRPNGGRCRLRHRLRSGRVRGAVAGVRRPGRTSDPGRRARQRAGAHRLADRPRPAATEGAADLTAPAGRRSPGRPRLSGPWLPRSRPSPSGAPPCPGCTCARTPGSGRRAPSRDGSPSGAPPSSARASTGPALRS